MRQLPINLYSEVIDIVLPSGRRNSKHYLTNIKEIETEFMSVSINSSAYLTRGKRKYGSPNRVRKLVTSEDAGSSSKIPGRMQNIIKLCFTNSL